VLHGIHRPLLVRIVLWHGIWRSPLWRKGKEGKVGAPDGTFGSAQAMAAWFRAE
jgi:hypothetical protein